MDVPLYPGGQPKEYGDIVDLRVIVITYNRAVSTLKLLHSLNNLILDGDTAALEIWIDRSKNGTVDNATVAAMEEFEWIKGAKRVHVQEKHVGIYGQWIDTWRPRGKELALILEDDISVSPYAWRWIKAMHGKFGGRGDILGYTLQSEGVHLAAGGEDVSADPEMNVFLNRQMGSWGFIPHPKVWASFQDWYFEVRQNKSFKPYLGGGVVFDFWYRNFERRGEQDSMWSIWFIHYTNKQNLYCVYSNLVVYANGVNHKLAVHRAEPGLHHLGQGNWFFDLLYGTDYRRGKDNGHELLMKWKDEYIKFPTRIPRYEFNGTTKMVEI